ncbi:hypothetical protein F1737_02600 [Methanoplanus sp. FWC-SCC4]|uniref:Uncharacterized protein n=1 Tax=Methanochimaera problematica TaxID=2609417 RepID=A0AA97FCR6_9EURY|nr:hypothetical protein [Methanoplanus sp. FWC-SCC4]WOF15653.1 hypothetical protein F1737_02600 [Methanoplanus sp. FWC-SCC4]
MAIESLYPEWWQWFQSLMWVVLLFIGLIIIYYIIREIQLGRVTPRLAEIDLEKEKLKLMTLEYKSRCQPFFRISPESLEEINKIDQENNELESTIFAKQSTVEKRIQKLENMVKNTKLDRMIEKIKDDERKIR